MLARGWLAALAAAFTLVGASPLSVHASAPAQIVHPMASIASDASNTSTSALCSSKFFDEFSHSFSDEFSHSFSHSFSNGFSHSFSDAFSHSFSDALSHSFSHSFSDGFSRSFSDAFSHSFSNAFSDAFSNAFSHAFDAALQAAISSACSNPCATSDPASFSRSFADAFSRSFADEFSHSFSNAFSHAFSDAFSHSFVDEFSHSFSDALSHAFSNAFADAFSHAFSHSFSDAFSNAFSHSFSNAFSDAFSHAFSHSFSNAFSHSFSHGFSDAFSHSFSDAFSHGFADAFSHGFADAFSHGFADAFSHGFADAFSHGFADALSHGFADAFSHGFADAFSHGFADAMSHGFADALSHGFADAFSHGFADAFSHGFADAFSHGFADALSHGFADSFSQGFAQPFSSSSCGPNDGTHNSPHGLSPAQVIAAYNWPTSPNSGKGQTIAVVEAYNDPNIEQGLAAFDTAFGLPSCTQANGCLRIVGHDGGDRPSLSDPSWSMETSVDVEWAHAIAPGAHILLVEADSSFLQDMLDAVSYAAAHAGYVSNSWGQSEFAGENHNDSRLSHSGASVFFASGDSGSAVYPASAPNVIAVGATTLSWDSAGKVNESGWAPSGGGCSSYESANSAQSSFAGYAQVGCHGARATPDVAADGAQASAVSVYDASPYNGIAGWWRAYGSSVPTPMWAARAADAGVNLTAAYVYGSSITYRQVTSGGSAPCYENYNVCAGRGSWIGLGPSGPPPSSGGDGSSDHGGDNNS